MTIEQWVEIEQSSRPAQIPGQEIMSTDLVGKEFALTGNTVMDACRYLCVKFIPDEFRFFYVQPSGKERTISLDELHFLGRVIYKLATKDETWLASDEGQRVKKFLVPELSGESTG